MNIWITYTIRFAVFGLFHFAMLNDRKFKTQANKLVECYDELRFYERDKLWLFVWLLWTTVWPCYFIWIPSLIFRKTIYIEYRCWRLRRYKKSKSGRFG